MKKGKVSTIKCIEKDWYAVLHKRVGFVNGTVFFLKEDCKHWIKENKVTKNRFYKIVKVEIKEK